MRADDGSPHLPATGGPGDSSSSQAYYLPSYRPLTCAISPPSADAWSRALAAHLLPLLLLSVPLGTLLHCRYYHRHSSTRSRSSPTMAVMVAILAASIPPAVVFLARPDLPWMESFLLSTFGFSTSLKSLAVAFGTCPFDSSSSDDDDGGGVGVEVEVDLTSFLMWYSLLPEPAFAKGKPVRLDVGSAAWLAAVRRTLGALLVKTAGLALLLPPLLDSPDHSYFGGGHSPSSDGHWADAWSPPRTLDNLSHLWFVYLWASFCLESSALSVLALGRAVDPSSHPPFRDPLLASRSLRETWNGRWNAPVHLLLRRAVYVPLRTRGAGWGGVWAAAATFACSGLMHEYNFALHNRAGYRSGRALSFFALMGALMLAEGAVVRRWRMGGDAGGRRRGPGAGTDVGSITSRIPSVVIALALQVGPILPAFGPLFARSWLDSGAVEAVSEMVPLVRCHFARPG